MSDIQLFRLSPNEVIELPSRSATLERELQTTIERHMAAVLGVRFLASEFPTTGRTHRGRIDSLGLDENNCPVIVEYKRHTNENVINQGLFYLDWLLDHRAEFRWLVMERYGREVADAIEWTGTRLLCIAADFTRYDQHAIQQMPRNIELLRYKYFGEDLLLLELVNAHAVPDATNVMGDAEPAKVLVSRQGSRDKTFAEQMAAAPATIIETYAQLESFVLSLGDDVQKKELKLYTAYKRLKNFASVVVAPAKGLLLFLALNPSTVNLEDGFTRDMTTIGHWGTGDLEVTLASPADIERAKPLIERAYSER